MKQKKGIVYNRRQFILEYLKEHKTAETNVLANILSTSPITIRRDFQSLEDEGVVQRYYGGATLIQDSLNKNYFSMNISEIKTLKKEAIAKKAATFINDGDLIFINSSSTALLILKYIKEKHVVVITNNGKALNMNLSPSIELILTGGTVYGKKQSLVGNFASQLVSKITATKTFLGVSGITASLGLSTSVLPETTINQKMMTHCSGPIFILTDSSKVGKHHNFSSGDVTNVSYLITDSNANKSELEQLNSKGVKTILVEVPNNASNI